MTKLYRSVAALCAVGVLVAFSASSALAHRGRVFSQSFGAPGSGAGQLSLVQFTGRDGSNKTVTVGGSGLAVNENSHNIYIADTGNDRVDEFTAAGVFVRAWGWGVENGASELQVCTEATGCRAGLPGTSPGQFDSPAFVAVDDSPGGEGDVYVADYRQGDQGGDGPPEEGDRLVQKFTAEGALVESWGNKGQINENTNFTDKNNILHKISIIGGIAVRPSGELIIGTNSGIYELAQSSGAFLGFAVEEGATEFPHQTTFPNGLSVGGSGSLYFEESSGGVFIEGFGAQVYQQIVKFAASRAPDGYVFAFPQENTYITGIATTLSEELYVDRGNAIQEVVPSCTSQCTPTTIPTTTFTSAELTKGAGLAVDSQREILYIAETAADKIESIVPEPPASPLIEAGSQTVSDVSGDSATLEAMVNPRSEPNEEPTTYRFQYTTDERFQREGFEAASNFPVPDGQLAASYEGDLVTARVQGLVPETTYHYRVVAENEISREEGKPSEGERNEAGQEVVRTFTTQPAGVFSLPDGRAWELVSPPDKHGSLLFSLRAGMVSEAATDGNAVTYIGSAPTEAQPAGNSNSTQVLSTRTDDWSSLDIATSRTVANGDNEPGLEEYRFFSSDLSLAIAQIFGKSLPPLSPEASEMTPFLRSDYAGGNRQNPCVSSCYRPLVTGAPGFANVPEGTEFGRTECGIGECGPFFRGASPDGNHIVLESEVPLTEGAPARSLYEWGGGQIELVSVLPENTPVAGELGSQSVSGDKVVGNAVSEDGSRVVWSTRTGGPQHLYLRDTTREETVELGGGGAIFQTASANGSRVFFTAGGDLFVFEAPLGGALLAGHTTDLTPGGGVLETVLGAAGDGSSIYFVATKALTNTPSPQGEQAQAGRPNLYVYHAGTIALVAVLSEKDAPDWGGNGAAQMTTTRVSPDGGWLAFMSMRSLTGYDNRDVVSGVPDEEVFLYDAAVDDGAGGLVCASCDPTRARPHGLLDKGIEGEVLVDEQGAWQYYPWLAANIPAWTSPLYQSRYLSDSGRLFFNSDDALVASDTNGTEDVYEYEPGSVGDCATGSVSFSGHSGGCIDLISSGVAKEESVFLDASETGDDVFFLTSAQLTAADSDGVPDVYDARVDGGFPASQPPPACEGDACQSPVAAPNDPTPGSLTYHGPGNPVPLLTPRKTTKKKAQRCVKGKKLIHGKCVKSRPKKKARKANRTKDRRAGIERGGRS